MLTMDTAHRSVQLAVCENKQASPAVAIYRENQILLNPLMLTIVKVKRAWQ